MLLPLIEFEFAFNGSQKPAITQSELNLPQLKILFEICRKQKWLSTQGITKLGKKNEYWFKISNSAFKEIYEIAGPMADKNKDAWARLLCERANNLEKNRNCRDEILKLLSKSKNELTTRQICLDLRRLPYTITRHLRILEKKGAIKKTEKGWLFLSASIPAHPPT